MRCDQVLSSLESTVDRESPLTIRLRAAAHCAVCPACRAERSAIKRLRSLSCSLTRAPLPSNLELRLLESLPASSGHALQSGLDNPKSRIQNRRSGNRRRLAAVFVPALAAIVALLLLTPTAKEPASAAAMVRGALANVNTWHLKGWRLKDGVQVPWEVWVRRKPFFYREQMGDDLILDDGVTRTVVLGPEDKQWRKRGGIVVRMPSASDDENVRWSYRRMVEIWQADQWAAGHTPEGPIFNYASVMGSYPPGNETAYHRLHYVNRSTWLPYRFEVRRGPLRGPHEFYMEDATPTAQLDIQFESPIPPAVYAQPDIPFGYQLFDAAECPKGVDQRFSNTDHGITVEVKPLAMAEDGTTALQVRSWLGAQRLDGSQNAALRVSYSETDGGQRTRGGLTVVNAPKPRQVATVSDDCGRAYGEIYWSPVQYVNNYREPWLLLFTPAEPFGPSSRQPRALNVTLDLEVTATSTFGEALMEETSDVIRLAAFPITISVSAPKAAGPIKALAESCIGIDWRKRNPWVENGFEVSDTLEARVYQARNRLYRDFAFEKSRKGVRWQRTAPERSRAAYWNERYIETGSSISAQRERLELAKSWAQAGNKREASKHLNVILNDRRFDHLESGFASYRDETVAQARELLNKLRAD